MINLLPFIFLITLVSCAKPNYVSENDLAGQIDGITGDCGLLFRSERICLKTTWIDKPSESTYGKMDLMFVDASDHTRFIDPRSDVDIVLWMPSMGHGSSPVTVKRTDVGQFRASEIFFIMPGPWEIRYQLKNGSKVVEQKTQKITI